MTTYGGLLLAAAVGAAPSATYVDAVDYPARAQGQHRFRDLEERLIRDFGHMCPDTFCKGMYRRIQPLRYRCSVESATGVLGECVWVLAASEPTVDPSSGAIVVAAPVWHCRTPLANDTHIEDFYQALKPWGG
ncbi:MAG TPA: hypothetical protein VGO76_11640, partial [Luteibacter sp.]|nr:hypothetical protein [Luteibacter sp.]